MTIKKKYNWLFWAVPQDALADERLNTSEVIILGILYTRINADYTAWPSQQYLAEKLHSSVRNIRRNLDRLEKFGWLTMSRTPQHRINSYQMRVPDKMSPTLEQVVHRTPVSAEPDISGKRSYVEEIDNKIPIAANAAWDGKELGKYLSEMSEGQPHIRLILSYWSMKGGVGLPGSSAPIQFGSKAETQHAISRSLRVANRLVKAYSWSRLEETMSLLADYATFSWTLETLEKYISQSPQKIKESLQSMKRKVYA